MYKIIDENGETVGMTDKVFHIKRNPRTGDSIPADGEADAEGVSINGKGYHFEGKAAFKNDGGKVIVIAIDAGAELAATNKAVSDNNTIALMAVAELGEIVAALMDDKEGK